MREFGREKSQSLDLESERLESGGRGMRKDVCTRHALPRSHRLRNHPHQWYLKEIRHPQRLYLAKAALSLLLAAAVYESAGSPGQCAVHGVVEVRDFGVAQIEQPRQQTFVTLLQLRGGGRRRVARPMTRMKLGHLSKVVEKRASNIVRRQRREAQRNAHYDRADGVWEILNSQELKEIKKEEKASVREAKRKAALKIAKDPDAEVSSDEDGRRVIVDFADIDKAKRELAAAAMLDQDLEEDTLADIALLPTAQGPVAGLPPERQAEGEGQSQRESQVHPPRGAVVYPLASETALPSAIASLEDNQTLWLEAGRHKWEPRRKSSKDQAIGA